MHAYAYIRFSTPKQEKGDSLRRQTDDVAGFCDRQGWTIVETIQDLGQSAWTGAHLSSGELGIFAERVRRGEIKMPAVLVVEKLDRLSRQEPRKTLRWLEDLCEKGLSIATVDGGRIYTDASLRADLMGTFEILMRAQLAHQESEQKSQRVLGAIGARMERAQSTGQKITAKAPGWLTLNADRMGFTVDEARAALVRSVYEMAAAGQGARWIAKTLNERGLPAWGPAREDGKPRTWEISSVKLMLAQPSVEGDYEPGFSNTSKTKRTKFSERIVGYYPRIVDADLVARARAAVQGRMTGPRSGGRHTANVANLFAGLIRCGACGNRMHLRSNGERLPKRYLHCNHASRSRGCDQKVMFAYDPLEAAVLDQILHLALDDRHFARPDETAELASRLAEIGKSIDDRKAVSRRLVRLAAMTDDEDPAIVSELNDNRKALTDLEERRGKVATQLEAARGAVSPEEHLARVRDLRGALHDEEPTMRQAARLRVLSAMQGLGVSLTCRASETRRETVLSLPTGLVSRISHDGGVVMHADLTKVLSRDLAGLTLEDAARRVAKRLDKAEAKIGHWDRGTLADAGAVEVHMRRQQQRDVELAIG